MEQSIQSIDSNMAVNTAESHSIQWYLPYEAPFRLSGFPYFSEDGVYRRLPLRTKELFERVNNNLNILGEDTAGGQIAFRTDSTRIFLKVKLLFAHDMVNMAATGQCGFDCYLGHPGERLKFFGVTRYDIHETDYECEVVANLKPGIVRDVVLNFPLYGGVKEVRVGLESGCRLLPPAPYNAGGKVVFYGTSITQGGCAARPGMAYTNILSRWLNRECFNLGFSANGLGEYEMAELIADLPDPAMVVLDYEANSATTGRLEASLEGFIERIRHKHPATPILVLTRIPYLTELYDEEMCAKRVHYREFQRKVVENRRLAGDQNIYFYNGHDLYDEYFDEYTVDFIHPTDLGFWKMAQGLYPVLKNILEGTGHV